MAEAELNPFLTLWFGFDALLNTVCGTLYFFFPRLFFAGIGGPYGHNVTPNMEQAVNNLAAYFIVAAGTMVVGARCKDVAIRRQLMIVCGTTPGVMLIIGLLVRAMQPDASLKLTVIGILATTIICAPYLYFLFVSPERGPDGSLQSSQLEVKK